MQHQTPNFAEYFHKSGTEYSRTYAIHGNMQNEFHSKQTWRSVNEKWEKKKNTEKNVN